MAVAGARYDVHDPAEVVLHRLDGGQAVQRPHNEQRISDPTIAIVPVSFRAGGFGNAGCKRSDDGAGRLVIAQLQRDRGADDGVLPFRRQSEPVHPGAPIELRALFVIGRRLRCPVGQGLVRTENEVDDVAEIERRLVRDVIDRRIGR